MKILIRIKKLVFRGVFALLVFAGVFGFAGYVSAYATTGYLVSSNLVSGETPSIIDSFTYYASSIPAGTALYAQFSKDAINWFSSAEVYGNWDTLSSGSNTIDLTGLGWGGTRFYYKIKFTSDGTDTPLLDSINVAFHSYLVPAYDTYPVLGTMTSINLLTGETVTAINSFTYNASSIPAGTGLTVQFSQDNSNWYSSAGVLDGSNTLSSGTNEIDLSGLGWSGANFYYKMSLTSDASDTSILDSISVAFTSDATPPVPSSFSPASASTITDSTPTITFTLDENGDCYASTTDETYDNMSDNTNCTGDGTTSISCTLSDLGADGSKNIYIACKDTAYSNKDDATTNENLTYTLDVTAPTTSDNFTNDDTWVATNQTITLTPADATSSVSWTKYCTDTTNTCTVSSGTAYTTAVTISTEGTSYFRYASQDSAGNTQTTVSRTVKIDKTAPLTSLSTARNGNTINATLTCVDSSGSGCGATYYCVDTEGACTPTTAYTTTVSFLISTNTWVRYYSTDFVLNTAAVSTSSTLQPTGGSGGDISTPWSQEIASPPGEAPRNDEEETPTAVPNTQNQIPITQIPQQIVEQITEQIIKIGEQIGLIQPKQPKPTEIVAVPEETPFAFQKQEELLPSEPIKQFAVSPLPKELKFFTDRFIGLEKTFKDVGILKIDDVTKLKNTDLRLPGLTEATQLALGEIKQGAMPSGGGIPVSKMSLEAKQKMPSEIVFAKAAAGLIDFNIVLSINSQGEPEQKIKTIAGKPLELVVKPDKPVNKIKGYLIFKDNRAQSGFLKYIFEALPAALSPARQKKLVLQEFEYEDFDKDGIYTANIFSPLDGGEYDIITVMDYKDPGLALKELQMVLVVDPEGYVFTQLAEGKLRIEGATVSIFWLNPSTSFGSAQDRNSGQAPKYELWPARKYSQNNPYITDDTGKYSFLAPEGTYYLKVEAKNYFDYQTDSFVVAENGGVHMNIELTKKSWWQSLKNWIADMFRNKN